MLIITVRETNIYTYKATYL